MIISRAPLRISFFGGGTDHPEFFLNEGGAVLSTAIDKYTYVTANRFLSYMFEYAIRLSYSSVELVKNVNEIEHQIFRECLKRCGIKKDLALHSIFDTHAYSGLGTSSSLTVSVLQALHCFNNKWISPRDLAREAIYVERNMVKDKVGCQDQIAAAYGGLNFIEFQTEKDFVVNRIALSPRRLAELESYVFIVYTGKLRKASEITAHQLKKIKENTQALKDMKRMAYEGRDILVNNKPLRKFGELLGEAWGKKRTLDGGVSNSAIDEMYEKGLKAGALGGKLLGAGGGGFLLFFAEHGLHPKLAKLFQKKNILPVKLNAPGAQIIFS
ncbi:MAG: GHMP kinase [bacterium]|nr:GHMP kinase [bacterium]